MSKTLALHILKHESLSGYLFNGHACDETMYIPAKEEIKARLIKKITEEGPFVDAICPRCGDTTNAAIIPYELA